MSIVGCLRAPVPGDVGMDVARRVDCDANKNFLGEPQATGAYLVDRCCPQSTLRLHWGEGASWTPALDRARTAGVI